MKSEVLTTIFPCYQESKSNIVNSAKKIESLCKRFGLRSNFVVAQNGDEKEFDFDEEYISTCYIPHRGFGEVLIKSLRKVNGDYVYISSPDTPFDLMDLEQMLYVRMDHDLIVGSKLHEQSVYLIEFTRKVTTSILRMIIKVLFPKFIVRDTNGSIFMNRKVIDKVAPTLKSKDFFFSTELLICAHRQNMKIHEVPVTYVKPFRSTSVNITSDGFRYFTQLLKLAFIDR